MNKDNEVLVIQSGYFLKNKQYKDMYDGILKQMEHGLVILPPGYEAVVVPKDIEVKVDGQL